MSDSDTEINETGENGERGGRRGSNRFTRRDSIPEDSVPPETGSRLVSPRTSVKSYSNEFVGMQSNEISFFL